MKNIKFKNILIALVLLPCVSLAQQRVQRAMFTQYQFNPLAINPAYSAADEQGRITALTRHQWVGFDGAPQTQTITGYMTLPNEKTSVGAMFIHDKVGPENEQAFFGTLAQRVQLSADAYLAAGFTTGIGYYLGDYGNVPLPDSPPDQTFVNQSSWRANVGLGLIYFDQRWEFGLAVPYLAKFNVGNSNSTTSMSALRSDFYLTANYRFQMNDFIKLKPAMMVKYTLGVPLEFDVNLNAYFEDKGLWLGAGYRSNAAVMAMFQVKVNDRIQLGYSHDFMTSLNVRHQMGTHEVMLNYRFKGGKKNYNANNLRF